ncbi:L,D-transpeptidase [Planosporangium mesophilum]|nr:L,D-transpeptidase [Planosporangium mesophilum]
MWLWLSLAGAGILLVAAVVVDLVSGGDHRPATPRPSASTASTPAPSHSLHTAVPLVSAAQLDALPEASTWTTLPAAPITSDRSAIDGTVVHPTAAVAVFTEPGDTAFARLPTTQVGSPTWLPVIDRRPGWVRVLLPTRPNGATGWLADSDQLQAARTPFDIEVDLAARSLRLLRDGDEVGRWTIGVGTPVTPTPAGRTFVLASVTDPTQTYSPVILPLGVHSNALSTFAGGPGTVGLHTWPTPDVYGTPTSHGCIRVPPDAMRALMTVPLGTPVVIHEHQPQPRGRTYPQ